MTPADPTNDPRLLRLGERVFGPIPLIEVRRRLARGELTIAHEVSSDNGATWKTMRRALEGAKPLADSEWVGADCASEEVFGTTVARPIVVGSWTVSPLAITAVGGGLIALTLALPVGRDGHGLLWWNDVTPFIIAVAGIVIAALLFASPSPTRAMTTLVFASIAGLASAIGICVEIGAWGLGSIILLGAGALAVLGDSLNTPSTRSTNSSTVWVIVAFSLAVALVIGVSIYKYHQTSNRFLVLNGARFILITLSATLVCIVAFREWCATASSEPIPYEDPDAPPFDPS
ncbi:MAG: hypothetical protein O2800_01455 [Planctomycetota bacterium]|nr:hypothetical protein [Planctomycetota bacterium]